MDYTVLYRTRADGYEEAIYFEPFWVREAVAKLYPGMEPEEAWLTFVDEYTTEETDQLLSDAILAHTVAARCCKDLSEIEEYEGEDWRSKAIAVARASIEKKSFAQKENTWLKAVEGMKALGYDVENEDVIFCTAFSNRAVSEAKGMEEWNAVHLDWEVEEIRFLTITEDKDYVTRVKERNPSLKEFEAVMKLVEAHRDF